MGSQKDINALTEMIGLCQEQKESTLQRESPGKLQVLSSSCFIRIPEANEAPALSSTWLWGC